MKGMRSFAVVLGAALLFVVFASVFTVDEREKALVIRFGEIQRAVEAPGLYFKLPFIDEVTFLEDRMIFFESLDKTAQAVDGRRYLVDAITMLRIVDPITFRQTLQARLTEARKRIDAWLDSALRQTYGRRAFEAALSADRAEMMREIRDTVRTGVRPLGIEIVDVRIRRTDLLPDVLKDTYDAMNAERFAEAALLRAVGESARIRIRAEAERESVELVSDARRRAEIVRGEGDAERNRVFAEAFSKDPEFFAFYRSMQAYARSLKGNDTTLVLKPDSEFFEFFGRAKEPQSQK